MSFLKKLKFWKKNKKFAPGGKKKKGFNYRLFFSGLIFYICIVLMVALDFSSIPNLPRVNEVASFDIKSPVDLEIVDKTQTELMKAEAVRNITPVYKYDEKIFDKIKNSVNIVISILENSVVTKKIAGVRQISEELKENNLMDFDMEDKYSELAVILNRLRDSETKEIILFCQYMNKLLTETLSRKKERLPGLDYEGVKSEDIPEIVKITNRKIRNSKLSSEFKEFAGKLFFLFVQGTYVIDEEEMELRKKNIRRRIQPIKRNISKGEIIVRNGEIVKNHHIETFTKLNMFEFSQKPWSRFFGSLIVALVTFGVILFYLFQFKKDEFGSGRVFNLLATIILFMLFIAKCGRFLLLSDAKITILSTSVHFFSPFVVPVFAGTMLIALLIDANLALLCNMILGILIHIVLHLKTFDFIFAVLVSGTLAVLVIKKVNKRSDLTQAGKIVSITNVLIIVSVYLMEGNIFNPNFYSFLVRDASWGFVNGFVSTVVAIGFLPYLESLFKISTSMRLLELSDLNQPLMRRLLVEAPGTYHHSIVVGTLAEAAAKEIGADALLCRVGSYYHDIGKLKRPNFFVENQMGHSNVHDSIKPNLSALVIMSHCREGRNIGVEYNLPVEILDVIEQHHGTNLIMYFYLKSQTDEDKGDDKSRQEIFRYPGPKPQTKEAAIIFMADTVEAATRSISKPTPASLKGMIKKLTNERFTDGQFDECDLTLKDMEKINFTFVKTILGMFHSRIEYPSDDKNK